MLRRSWILFLILMLSSVPFEIWGAETVTQPQPSVLSLENCLKLGYENSQDLKLAAQNIKVAREGVRQAAGGFWPTLNYAIEYDRTNAGTVSYVPLDTVNWDEWKAVHSQGYGYGGSLSLTLPLYTGGKLTGNLKIALLQLENAREDERIAKQELTYNIKKAFYSLWLAEQELKVAQSSYENLGQHYQQVEKLYKVGKTSKYEFLKAQVDWKKQQPKIIAAENSVKTARLSLATLAGIGKDQDFEVRYEDSLFKVPSQTGLTLQPLLEEANQQRPEIRQANRKIEIARLKKAIAKAGYKPTVSLSGIYGGGNGNNLAPGEWEKTWTLSLGLNGILFDGLSTASKVKEAEENVQIAAITDTKVRDQIQQDVQEALQGLEEYLASVNVNQDNIELAQEALRMSEARFEVGMATTMDVSDSQLSLNEALNGYYQGISSYLTAAAKLDLVLGRDCYK